MAQSQEILRSAVLKACQTGQFEPFKSNISHILTKLNAGLTIFSAAGYWNVHGNSGFTDKNVYHKLGYNKYQNGSYITNVSNK